MNGLTKELAAFTVGERRGRVEESVGTVLRVSLPDVQVGEICRVQRMTGGAIDAEVVGALELADGPRRTIQRWA